MSNALPDFTSLNAIAGALSNPHVTSLYLRRTAIFGIGFVSFFVGFAVLIAGSKTGRDAIGMAVQGGAAVATDGASLAATAAAKGAKKVAGK